jgi:hypothetical protein
MNQLVSGSRTLLLSLFPISVPFPSICLSLSISQSQGDPAYSCPAPLSHPSVCLQLPWQGIVPHITGSCPSSQPHPPQRTPLPSSAGPLITHPDPHSPLPPPPICFPNLSVSLSVHPSIHPSFLPSPLGPISLNNPCVPSINLQTALCCQVVSSWLLICLSVHPPIHPSVSKPIHPSIHQPIHHASHLQVLV